MKLLFKQRMFSWFDSYDIYDEAGNAVYTVRGKMSWGHRLEIYGANDVHVGTVQERVFTFLPKFELYIGDRMIGEIQKEMTFLRPKFALNCNGWSVEGNWMEWSYQVRDRAGQLVMTAEKELFQWTDTYIMDIVKEEDALLCLMVVLAIDAVKCSSK